MYDLAASSPRPPCIMVHYFDWQTVPEPLGVGVPEGCLLRDKGGGLSSSSPLEAKEAVTVDTNAQEAQAPALPHRRRHAGGGR
jgi:hypothetical protein